jgi:hypothetical protein
MPQISDVKDRGEPRMMSGGGKGVAGADIRIDRRRKLREDSNIAYKGERMP